ncbi:anthranilate synthase component II [Tannockella kyphosi]|uniref:anthranilate synthase component II n=1 Tax=Tannockella kyphosi TaxID=2899121 RepID=UPI002011A274|nr:aminodeoxychorismate/anthranilate synthase component II [Tannockella kyphosi]
MILLIDNYDSFSYNLYQLIGSIEPNIQVVRNDKITIAKIEQLNPESIFLSPGPGHPRDAGKCVEIIQKLGTKYPIFGVCLGHQAICHAYGATVSHASKLMHGKTSEATINTKALIFQEMEEKMIVARYHSLSAKPDTIPDCLEVIARSEDGDIMAIQHCQNTVFGVQFHPESILTPEGKKIIENFIGGYRK